ncbi:MAG TPA: KpsF/GutQ family sugar-phosphate isomerase [Candidatus Kryptonia bacterium]|nr:KpsF/GutQ family sugar-phosphate isomerase [Candidatus Kryptonia bacterium]
MPLPRKARRPPAVRRGAASPDVKRARRVLAVETAGIAAVADRLDQRFDDALALLQRCRGKVVVTGMGKSGLIARKIAATLASTGTPALFLHAAEALHGDSGMLARGDVVVALSYSGETEVVQLLPFLKRLGLPLIVFTGQTRSTLARAADVVLDVAVPEEACPLGLAPTASTTAQLALGDALAVALLERRGFKTTDFAHLHPSGALGRRLLKVEDLMHRGEAVPLVTVDTAFKETVIEMTTKRLGVTGVVDHAGALIGVVTDGDLRRALERATDVRALTARELMSSNPKTVDRSALTVEASALAAEALELMDRFSITSVFIVDPSRRPQGLIHIHDLLRAGVV